MCSLPLPSNCRMKITALHETTNISMVFRQDELSRAKRKQLCRRSDTIVNQNTSSVLLDRYFATWQHPEALGLWWRAFTKTTSTARAHAATAGLASKARSIMFTVSVGCCIFYWKVTLCSYEYFIAAFFCTKTGFMALHAHSDQRKLWTQEDTEREPNKVGCFVWTKIVLPEWMSLNCSCANSGIALSLTINTWP